jgi:hypothetical protein
MLSGLKNNKYFTIFRIGFFLTEAKTQESDLSLQGP